MDYKKDYSTMRVSKELKEELRILKHQLMYESADEVLRTLLDNYKLTKDYVK